MNRLNKKVGFTCSTFDLLHAGHIQMLREAKEQCDYLIVGIQTDPTIDRPKLKNSPVQTLVERYAQIKAVSYVDEIIPYQYEKDLWDILKAFQIDIRIVGADHKNTNFSGLDICKNLGIEVYYNHRNHDFSSTELRKRIAEAEAKKSQ